MMKQLAIVLILSMSSFILGSGGTPTPKMPFKKFFFECLFKSPAISKEDFYKRAAEEAEKPTSNDWFEIDAHRESLAGTLGVDLPQLFKIIVSPKMPFKKFFFETLFNSPELSNEEFLKRAHELAEKPSDEDWKAIEKLKKTLAANCSPELLPQLYKSKDLFSEKYDQNVQAREPEGKVYQNMHHRAKELGERAADEKSQSNSYKEQDEERLSNLCRECIENPELLPFIETAIANFTQQYAAHFEFRGVHLSDGQSFGSYLDSHKDSWLSYRFAEIKSTQERYYFHQEKTSWWKKIFVVGIVGIGGYLLYKYMYPIEEKTKNNIQGKVS